jgi:hypothetical protein
MSGENGEPLRVAEARKAALPYVTYNGCCTKAKAVRSFHPDAVLLEERLASPVSQVRKGTFVFAF